MAVMAQTEGRRLGNKKSRGREVKTVRVKIERKRWSDETDGGSIQEKSAKQHQSKLGTDYGCLAKQRL